MQYSLTADYAANSQPFVTFQSGAAAQQTLEPHNHQQDHQDGDDDHDGYDYHDGDDDESPSSNWVLQKADTLQCSGRTTPAWTQPDRTSLLIASSRRSYKSRQ